SLGAAPPAPTDRHGDPLPPGAVARLGTVRSRHAGPVRGLAFSADGKTLLSAGHHTVRRWDAMSGRLLEVSRAPGGRGVSALSPDGRTVASVEGDALHLWDREGRRRLPSLVGRRGLLPRVAFAPDGKRAAVLGATQVEVLDVAAGEILRT